MPYIWIRRENRAINAAWANGLKSISCPRCPGFRSRFQGQGQASTVRRSSATRIVAAATLGAHGTVYRDSDSHPTGECMCQTDSATASARVQRLRAPLLTTAFNFTFIRPANASSSARSSNRFQTWPLLLSVPLKNCAAHRGLSVTEER